MRVLLALTLVVLAAAGSLAAEISDETLDQSMARTKGDFDMVDKEDKRNKIVFDTHKFKNKYYDDDITVEVAQGDTKSGLVGDQKAVEKDIVPLVSAVLDELNLQKSTWYKAKIRISSTNLAASITYITPDQRSWPWTIVTLNMAKYERHFHIAITDQALSACDDKKTETVACKICTALHDKRAADDRKRCLLKYSLAHELSHVRLLALHSEKYALLGNLLDEFIAASGLKVASAKELLTAQNARTATKEEEKLDEERRQGRKAALAAGSEAVYAPLGCISAYAVAKPSTMFEVPPEIETAMVAGLDMPDTLKELYKFLGPAQPQQSKLLALSSEDKKKVEGICMKGELNGKWKESAARLLTALQKAKTSFPSTIPGVFTSSEGSQRRKDEQKGKGSSVQKGKQQVLSH